LISWLDKQSHSMMYAMAWLHYNPS